jgi:hypothetical protein
MDIVDRTTVFTEAHGDTIFFSWIFTLTREYDPFSGDRHLMDESLVTKCIDDTVESREVHTIFMCESRLQIREGDARILGEDFDEATTLEGYTGFCHRGNRVNN